MKHSEVFNEFSVSTQVLCSMPKYLVTYIAILILYQKKVGLMHTAQIQSHKINS